MNSNDWHEIKEIFSAAFDLPDDERARFLAQYDEVMRLEVEKLLRADKDADNFIVEPAMVDAGLSDDDDSLPDGEIDGYEILSEIGQGGMGKVYLARRSDRSFDKTVAIKLIKRGMDTSAVLKRFLTERSILAQLDHPNIAGLIDGGTTSDGLPYFVMEYVDGLPITKYCDANTLTIRERLGLFRKVCAAVSYAHANLVVHRDVKPSNILVTHDGTPKLLDFGIAKMLHPDPLETDEATATMFRILTPEYASPEQISGQPITTATDVYSLGVVLYELLCGERPYKIKGGLSDEAVRQMMTAEPVRPSSVVSLKVSKFDTPAPSFTTRDEQRTTNEQSRTNPRSKIPNLKAVRGDLDNIVLKAIRKEPERRYPSVQEFSEDIRRHLSGMPVTATADTKVYRLKKFVQRHSAAVAAGALIILTLIAATTVTAWQAVAARRERARAEQRFNDVRKLANSFLFEFEESIKDLPGATPAREMTVKTALEYLDILAQEQSDDPSLQFELALAYAKVADIQGSPGFSNLGDTAGAVASFRKAIGILEGLTQAAPDNRQFKSELASDYKSLAYIYEVTGDAELTQSNNQSAFVLYRELVESDETDINSKLLLAECYKSIGDFIASKGDLDSALQNYRKYLEIGETVLSLQPDNKVAKRAIMAASDAIGTTLGNPNYTNLGDTDGALRAHARQLEICNEMLAADPGSQYLQSTKAFTLKIIGEVQTARGEWKQAVESYRQSLSIQEPLIQKDPKDAFEVGRFAYLLSNLGEALANVGEFESSLKYHKRAIELLEGLATTDHENSALTLSLNRSYQKLGDTLVATGKENEALSFYHKALESNEGIAAEDENNMDMRLQLANDYLKIGLANMNLAQKAPARKRELWTEARNRFEKAREVFAVMQAHNLKIRPIENSLADIAKHVEQCDQALAKL